MALDADIKTVLWTEADIATRVAELASQISDDFLGSSSSLVAVGVATGAFLFLADVVRRIKLPIEVDFIRAESYGAGTESSGALRISCDLKIDVAGKHVILVEDIVDTGNTLLCLIAHLESKGASSVSVCALLNKAARRKVELKLVGEGKFYCGFECPDYFVVGYGMDFAELYRNLPYVGVLKPEMYK
ncbi:hypoxanthine-guanine phosphoribosyltransferase [Dioscorea cayenensis subsp. rotundata]|uniref:Hypoxanthine phosphoribosyltransferase n=1 Tax=Dioscorea cayennensis subsp. rotundata TaxID=55577 RepID=A0AB40B9I5_DIOCR|nr:hypoxanthine-guanine phosphoribosyltransferase [Dioscorea cayenensis subsp. rotundata]